MWLISKRYRSWVDEENSRAPSCDMLSLGTPKMYGILSLLASAFAQAYTGAPALSVLKTGVFALIIFCIIDFVMYQNWKK